MMDFKEIVKTLPPAQFVYGTIALLGGMARYFNDYVHGKPFKFRMFLASTFVAGFSGWMFAVMGETLQMPQPFVFVMAGTGGFFGEQTMKLIMDYVAFRSQAD